MAAIDWLPGGDIPGLFQGLRQEFPEKPLLAVSPLGDRKIYLRMNQGFLKLGIPCYASVEDAIKALAALYRYQQYRAEAD